MAVRHPPCKGGSLRLQDVKHKIFSNRKDLIFLINYFFLITYFVSFYFEMLLIVGLQRVDDGVGQRSAVVKVVIQVGSHMTYRTALYTHELPERRL
jgi:hypothetical protein